VQSGSRKKGGLRSDAALGHKVKGMDARDNVWGRRWKGMRIVFSFWEERLLDDESNV